MARFFNLFGAIFLMLMLVTASGRSGLVQEATRTCESKSQRFRGLCFSKNNCALVCKTEGFHGGHCRGFRRRCFCTKHC